MELKTDTLKLDASAIDPMIIGANIKLSNCSDINDYVNKFNKKCDMTERKMKRNIWIHKTSHKIIKKYR